MSMKVFIGILVAMALLAIEIQWLGKQSATHASVLALLGGFVGYQVARNKHTKDRQRDWDEIRRLSRELDRALSELERLRI